MSELFLNCVKKNGKVITKKIDKNKYMHICYLNGKAYPGEILYKESSKEKKAKSKQ